ncbi:proline-rich protein 18 [Erpetoichthys calabaricus]|uniref:Proline rich 18 n=1 Tax=Erpetoichthys calabaricus TaxID=27687 RepID=A0A8C4TGK9_ERPCA|nr:proline-rich protein 18 [Erpetoichthys calabaricus]
MPFPPISLHQRISSPGKDLFRKKKPSAIPPQVFAGKDKDEKDNEKERFSSSWPAANFKHLGRRTQPRSQPQPHKGTANAGAEAHKSPRFKFPAPLANSCDSISASGGSGTRKSSKNSSRSSLTKEDTEEEQQEREIRFTLSLTPEAILVIQKRNLEKQLMAKQQKGAFPSVSSDQRHRRVFPGKRAQGSKGSAALCVSDNLDDIRAIVKISLLNDQYKYDDVEYEEDDYDVDETVMRKCKEWLEGVESAAAFGKASKLATLPHLNT